MVLGLVRRLGLSLALVLAKDCSDSLLTGGMACSEIEQLPRCPRFVVPELMDESFIGRARDKFSNHIHVYDVGKLIALLG